MSASFLTLAIPFPPRHVGRVNLTLAAIDSVARRAFNGLTDSQAIIHFMSINVICVANDDPAHLVLEASVDGSELTAIAHITRTIGDQLCDVLAMAGLAVPPSNLVGFLVDHQVKIGAQWSATPGAVFTGAPGLSVGRIRQEAQLAAQIGELLKGIRAPGFALPKMEFVRNRIFDDVHMKWALIAEPIPLLADAPPARKWPFVGSFLKTLLWPLALPPLGAAIIATALMSPIRLNSLVPVWLTLGIEVAILLLFIALSLLKLRRDERRDAPVDVEPNVALVEQIMHRENHIAQNHLASVALIKPGRRLILRLVFWSVGAVVRYASKPGFLSDIGTIHFARWFILPGTKRLLFFSNYDGSWNSYLEDFIVRAHLGLTGIWSNVVDFPRTRWLVFGGASDGARFKRLARRQQQPTCFWYSAYPQLTMVHIRANAAIRHGFASITTEKEAVRWLESLGYYAAPPLKDGHEVPTLAFGGASRLRYAHCLVVELAGESAERKNWLSEISPKLCYGQLLPTSAVAVVAGFSARGLTKLGMDQAGLATFPTAFQQGMTEPSRARALGDQGGNSHEHWWWGANQAPADAVLVVYANDPDTLGAQVLRQKKQLALWRQRISYDLALSPLPPKGQPLREPFGFIDGISQPIMHGKNSGAPANPIHSIEPGEIVLGHVNNSDHTAPTPQYQGFDFGRNGTYLVVRQMQQDTAAFEAYIRNTALRLSGAESEFGLSSVVSPEWIAAKMVGRWRVDGSPLVEFPSAPKCTKHASSRLKNDFLYGKLDPHGLRCPLGAHIRRANPRDSFAAGSSVQLALTNRHRIRRVGRAYQPGADKHSEHPGLWFMCVNADIETQFEFVQQTWLLGRTFEGLNAETDPLLGHHSMTIQTHRGPLELRDLPDFVKVRGGEYFFLPSKSALNFLCTTP